MGRKRTEGAREKIEREAKCKTAGEWGTQEQERKKEEEGDSISAGDSISRSFPYPFSS